MHLLTALISYSALVSAAPQILRRGDLITNTGYARMTNEQVNSYKSSKPDCWRTSNLFWPMNDTPAPIKETESKQLNIYTIPTTKPKTLVIHNYCSYDIFYEHHGKGAILGRGTLNRGGTFETPLIGTNWKASKTKDLAQVVQVEYNVPDTAPGELWYNLSLIDCLVKKNGLLTKDASGCAGLEAGLQFGNKERMSFQCAPNTWCDDQAYFYYENMCKNSNPVRTCSSSLGITMEFCAKNKK